MRLRGRGGCEGLLSPVDGVRYGNRKIGECLTYIPR